MARKSVYILLTAVFVLVMLGLVMLLSVSAFAPDNRGDAFFFIKRQAVWLVLGVAVCVVAALLDYRRWLPWTPWLLGGCALLMLACFVPGLGKNVKGASRWLDLGVASFQPSEFAKLALVAFLAWWLGSHQVRIRRFMIGVGIPMAVLGLFCGLLLLQRDLGSCVMLGLVTCILLFTAGSRLSYILPLPAVGLTGILTMAFFMPERRGRLLAFLDPEAHKLSEGYQPFQALVAFGSGGPTGIGLGQGVQKMYYLPEAHTDFIFPIIGEELGLIATLIIIFLFLLLTLGGIYISCHARDAQGLLLGLGSTSLICIQAGLNVAVVTSLVPAKGVGLPFISYGGTNLVLCLTLVGILLNIHRHADYETFRSSPVPIEPIHIH
jgi:cell division protein FtsW